jgi:beta-glucanase (GH16 family)
MAFTNEARDTAQVAAARTSRRGHKILGYLMASAVFYITLSGGLTFRSFPQAAEGPLLDLSSFILTFDEEFDDQSISARSSDTRWSAHTPWNGDFGDAVFTDPGPGFPFVVENGVLRIEARKGDDGRWRSGLISSRAADGFDMPGFAQQWGYFEMRAKLPAGPGVWPAFWLIGIDKRKFAAEIDVIEQYGAFPYVYQVAAQVHQKGGTTEAVGQQITVKSGVMSEDFNTYGVLISPDDVIFYFNRREVWRTKSRPEFHQPFYVLVNLALGGGWPIDETPNPSFMYVDYVKVFAPKHM